MTNELFEKPAETKPESYMDDLVGEGKKYATAEELAKSRYEADLFIEKLKQEKREAEEEKSKALADLQARKSVEELLATKEKEQVTPSTPLEAVEKPNSVPSVSTEDVQKLIEQKLSEATREQKQSANLNRVVEEIKKSFGDQANSAWEAIKSKTNVDETTLRRMASENPDLVITLAGKPETTQISSPSIFGSTIDSSKSASAVKTIPPGRKTHAQWMELKKSQGNHLDPKQYRARIDDAKALGDNYWS